MCLAQRYNAVTPMMLDHAALRSRVKYSTTEPLRSPSQIGDTITYFQCTSKVFYIFEIVRVQSRREIPVPAQMFNNSNCVTVFEFLKIHRKRSSGM